MPQNFLRPNSPRVVDFAYRCPFIVIEGVRPRCPVFTSEPSNSEIFVNGGTTFSVVVDIPDLVAYQWQISSDSGVTWTDLIDNDNYSGALTSILTLVNVPAEFNGFDYRCRVTTNDAQACVRTSTEASLTVDEITGPCVEHQLRSAEASICGEQRVFDDGMGGFTLKYYKTVTLAGSLRRCYFASSHTCGGTPTSVDEVIYSGLFGWTPSLDPDNPCVPKTQTSKADAYQNNSPVDCSSAGTFVGSTSTQQIGSGAVPFCIVEETETVHKLTGDGICHDLGGIGGSVVNSGEATMTFSSEDTLTDVTDRLDAAIAGQSFGAWSTDQANASLNIGLHSSKQEVNWRINRSGLAHNTTYSFTVQYWRRSQDEGSSFELFDTLSLSGTTDGSGNLVTSPVAVPVADGFDTQVRCDCVFVTAL